LKLRDPTKFLFEQLDTVATGPGLVLAGSAQGVFGSTNGGDSYESRSQTDFIESVALPSTWLFVSGTHQITVVSEGEPSA
jgi:hypothetical protein